MGVVEVYGETRLRLVELASELEAEQLQASVPALPGWSVQDTFAHVAGVCTDVLDGRMEDAGSPAWTARQVSERADRDIADICREWTASASRFEAWQEASGASAMFSVYDLWTHQQDVLGALGREGDRDGRVEFVLDEALSAFDGRIRAAGAPAVRVVTARVDRVLGDGEPAAVVRSDDYELMRMLFGRRSRGQIAGMDWAGDPTGCVDHLHLFELPVIDLAV